MTMQGCNEIPVTFECCDSSLFGIVHVPEEPTEYGLLTVVAGGPQYRAGCGRQLLLLARDLAASNIPVMRFDQRGVGDSQGEFQGFENMEEDLRAAIDTFKATVPSMKHIILWGGCDAGSSVLINAVKFPEVHGAILANPFVSSGVTQQALQNKHYLHRLTELSFWKKVFSFQYDFSEYTGAAMDSLRSRIFGKQADSGDKPQPVANSGGGSFVEKMLYGLQNLNGPILFLMSGHSPTRKEFDEFLTKFPEWSKAYSHAAPKRIDLPDADQTFSTRESREAANRAALDWMKSL